MLGKIPHTMRYETGLLYLRLIDYNRANILII